MLGLALLDGLGAKRLLVVPSLEAPNYTQSALRIQALARIVVVRAGEGELDESLAPGHREDAGGESDKSGSLHLG